MDLNARWLAKPDAVPALYTELSNNNIDTVFPRVIAGGDDYFLPQKGVDYLRGRLIQKNLLTGGRGLNILFYYSIKPKIDNIKQTEHGLFKCSKLFWLFD